MYYFIPWKLFFNCYCKYIMQECIIISYFIKENTYINVILTLILLREQWFVIVYSYRCSKRLP